MSVPLKRYNTTKGIVSKYMLHVEFKYILLKELMTLMKFSYHCPRYKRTIKVGYRYTSYKQ